MSIEPVKDICRRLLGYEPHTQTISRWQRPNKSGKSLKTYTVGGRVCTTESDLLQYLEKGHASSSSKTGSARGSSTPKTSAKRVSDAISTLEQEGL